MPPLLDSLPLLASGKVRDNYAVGEDRLLMVASDRLSAFDVVLAETLPGKGVVLTAISNFWFGQLAHLCPTHLTGVPPASVVTPAEAPRIEGRSVVVKRLTPIPVEAVVRGYLAGSGWEEYQRAQSVCGVPLPPGLRQASRLPEPIFTPVIKAPAGQHDENITYARLEQWVGADVAARLRHLSLALYRAAAAIALERGIIVADTKFEFGFDADGQVTLMDEVLTPDSSRLWPVETYAEGMSPPGYDKQALRDWLEAARVDGRPWPKRPPAPAVPAAVLDGIGARYREALQRLTLPAAR